jgi:F-type H+-transporting ATPase subunit delta
MNAGVSARYARALFELSIETGAMVSIQAELGRFVEAFDRSDDLRNVLLNPSISRDERRELLGALATMLQLSKLTTNFLLLLLDKNRVDQVPLIGATFRELADAKAGNVRAEVKSATKLSAMQVAKIKSTLGRLTGKTVLVNASVDESLLGGVVTRVAGKVYDGSLRTQLENMKTLAASH